MISSFCDRSEFGLDLVLVQWISVSLGLNLTSGALLRQPVSIVLGFIFMVVGYCDCPYLWFCIDIYGFPGAIDLIRCLNVVLLRCIYVILGLSVHGSDVIDYCRVASLQRLLAIV